MAETKTVKLSSPDRVLFPDDGITKGDVFAYYERVADTLVPHLRDRPFTMKRYPHGITGEVFFQKQAPKHLPSWIATRQFRTHPREGGSRLVHFALVNSPEAVPSRRQRGQRRRQPFVVAPERRRQLPEHGAELR